MTIDDSKNKIYRIRSKKTALKQRVLLLSISHRIPAEKKKKEEKIHHTKRDADDKLNPSCMQVV